MENKCSICQGKIKNPRNQSCSWECRNKRISKLYKGRVFTQDHKDNIKKNHHSVKGDKNPKWKGGRRIVLGYVLIWMPEHKYSDKQGYVREHRLVVEKNIGRLLKPEEVVHHLNGKKDDNRLVNLHLLRSQAEHARIHAPNRVDWTKTECFMCGKQFDKRNNQIKITKRNFCTRYCFFKSLK